MVKISVRTEEENVFLDVQKQGKDGRWKSLGAKRLSSETTIDLGEGVRIGIAEDKKGMVLQTSPTKDEEDED